jgi:hypothetical protein
VTLLHIMKVSAPQQCLCMIPQMCLCEVTSLSTYWRDGSDGVLVLCRVLAVLASAGPTVFPGSKAIAIQLQALRLLAVAAFGPAPA